MGYLRRIVRPFARLVLTGNQRSQLFVLWRDATSKLSQVWNTRFPPINARKLNRTVKKHLVHVTEPVVLITQAGRSGGSLLSQLFDGHPQCHVHPYEFRLGGPKSFDWPKPEIRSRPGKWFAELYEPVSIRLFETGYKKGRSGETFPFYLVPAIQRQLFLDITSNRDISTERHVYDAYMTSYFNAWLNNANLSGTKRWVVGFVPWLLNEERNLSNFFQIYPEGRVISIVREPVSWYASISRHSPAYRNLEFSIKLWMSTASAMIRNIHRYPEKVMLLKFEDLVAETSAVMKQLCVELQIEFRDSLLMPTFNRLPIKANTSFDVQTYGVIESSLSRESEVSPEDRTQIKRLTAQLYEDVIGHCRIVKLNKEAV